MPSHTIMKGPYKWVRHHLLTLVRKKMYSIQAPALGALMFHHGNLHGEELRRRIPVETKKELERLEGIERALIVGGFSTIEKRRKMREWIEEFNPGFKNRVKVYAEKMKTRTQTTEELLANIESALRTHDDDESARQQYLERLKRRNPKGLMWVQQAIVRTRGKTRKPRLVTRTRMRKGGK